ncbi:MAG: DUF1574 domain-containing protein [Leptospiraceae bacterium]|nr:DUF1574 domain-containing protein [Leptospiraceae bacterium]MDW7975787.1 DUF1574 family protein [Leptospiraceae bacterium]
MKNKEFYFPFVIFLGAFLLDKVFILGNFPLYYLTTISFVNFDQKETLLIELKDYLNQDKRSNVLVVLGNSRTMAFDNRYVKSKYPNWIFYNFSVPGGKQDYYLYLLEKFYEKKVQPEALIFALTPQAMNEKPLVLTDEVMVFGLSFDFILRNFYLYDVNEITNYIGKKLFVSYRFKPKLRIIGERLHEEKMLYFVNVILRTHDLLEKYQGSIPYLHAEIPNVTQEDLQKNANSIWQDFFTPFVFDPNAFVFLEKSLILAKKLQIPKIIFLWPPVSRELRYKKQKELIALEKTQGITIKKTVYEVWTPKMKELANRYNVQWLDLNFESPLDCEYFFDASHISAYCYPAYTDAIMRVVLK